MIATLEPTTVKTLPAIENLCQHEPLPQGKAAVLQDKFLELLKEASTLIKYQSTTKSDGANPHTVKLGDKSRYITLDVHDSADGKYGELMGEIWTKSGEYIALATHVQIKLERPFRIAVDFEALYLTVKLLSPERVDLIAHNDTNKLELRCGSCVSRFKGLPAVEMCEPIDSKPVVTYTKEQVKEFKWLGKAIDAKNTRYAFCFVHASTENGIPYLASSDGFRAHLSMNHATGLDGYIDVKSVGPEPDYKFPDVGWIAERITGQKINVYFDELKQAVKSVLKVKPDAGQITLSFSNHVLTLTAQSVERGEAVAHILCSTVSDSTISVKGQYILDALADCTGIPNRHDVNKKHTVLLQFENAAKPMKVVPHPGRMSIIMPMSKDR